MATPDSTPAPQNSVQIETLAAALAQAINQTKPPAKITVANRVAQNPMNPNNRKRKLEQKFYQNFSLVDVDDLTDAEYELVPRLKPGLFVSDGREGYLIEVVEVKRGAHRGIHLRYTNATPDARMEFMSRVGGSLEQVLTRCITDAATQRVERKNARNRDEE